MTAGLRHVRFPSPLESGQISLPSDVGFVPIVSQKSAERTGGAMFVLAPVPLWIFLAM